MDHPFDERLCGEDPDQHDSVAPGPVAERDSRRERERDAGEDDPGGEMLDELPPARSQAV
jgi:hypothetical protein